MLSSVRESTTGESVRVTRRGLGFALKGPMARYLTGLTALPISSIDEMTAGGGEYFLSSIELVFALDRWGDEHEVGASLKNTSSQLQTSVLFRAYKALASEGWRLRHGGKYGAHFLGYSPTTGNGHTHSECLIWVSAGSFENLRTFALSRVSRSVGKRVVFVEVGGEECRIVDNDGD